MDGGQIEILNTSGMMTLIVLKGMHVIQFLYHTLGLQMGFAVSFVFSVVCF